VCKLYTSFSTSTSGLLFLTTRLFRSVQVVKPVSSKATGPERYLVASGFLGNAEAFAIQSALRRAHHAGGGASPLSVPLLTPLVSKDDLASDAKFSESMKDMVSSLCVRQTQALNAVVDRADFLEDMAMDSAICTDPFERLMAAAKEEALQSAVMSVATPSRGGRNMDTGKGTHKGKGKGKGKSKGKSFRYY